MGYWPRSWRGDEINEIGWSVLPAFQRRGIARMATALMIERARAEADRRFLHAFPSVENPPSNALCRALGFTLLGPAEVEYPAGLRPARQRLAARPQPLTVTTTGPASSTHPRRSESPS